MKEITRIHLAATPFNVEIDAKRDLEKYLAAIEKSLQADEDALREIEARIVELLAERGVVNERAITRSDIEAIKTQLGEPGEFIDEQAVETIVHMPSNDKRLFRDQDRGVLGGVLAGIAAYFDVNPVWFRLIAIALTFASFGTVVLVYAVLWIALPPAKTAAEKLQMAGKPVTLESIKGQSEQASDAADHSKPLVIVLRVLLGIGFIGVAIAGLAVTGAALVASTPILGNEMNDASIWLFGAVGVAAISGILFVTLMSLAAYASFAWKVSKTMIVSAIIITMAGLTTFGTAVGIGFYGSNVRNQYLDSITHEERVELSTELRDVKRIVSESKSSATAKITYKVTNDTPYAEIKTVSASTNRPKLAVTRSGDEARLSIENTQNNKCNQWDGYCLDSIEVTVYGPALTAVEAKEGQVSYAAINQPELSVITHRDASVTISQGSVIALNAHLAQGSSLNASDAAINDVMVKTESGTSIDLGVLTRLTLETPESCPANSKVTISAERINSIVKAGLPLAQSDEINEACTQIRLEEPTQ